MVVFSLRSNMSGKRSSIWDSFDRVKDPATRVTFACCKLCPTRLVYEANGKNYGTSNLRRHCATDHAQHSAADSPEAIAKPKRRVRSSKLRTPSMTRARLFPSLQGAVQTDADELAASMVLFACATQMPMPQLWDPDFGALLQQLIPSPETQIPSQRQVERQLQHISHIVRQAMFHRLQQALAVSFLVDYIHIERCAPLLVVVARSVTSQFTLEERLVSAVAMRPGDVETDFKRVLQEALEGITVKPFTVAYGTNLPLNEELGEASVFSTLHSLASKRGPQVVACYQAAIDAALATALDVGNVRRLINQCSESISSIQLTKSADEQLELLPPHMWTTWLDVYQGLSELISSRSGLGTKRAKQGDDDQQQQVPAAVSAPPDFSIEEWVHVHAILQFLGAFVNPYNGVTVTNLQLTASTVKQLITITETDNQLVSGMKSAIWSSPLKGQPSITPANLLISPLAESESEALLIHPTSLVSLSEQSQQMDGPLPATPQWQALLQHAVQHSDARLAAESSHRAAANAMAMEQAAVAAAAAATAVTVSAAMPQPAHPGSALASSSPVSVSQQMDHPGADKVVVPPPTSAPSTMAETNPTALLRAKLQSATRSPEQQLYDYAQLKTIIMPDNVDAGDVEFVPMFWKLNAPNFPDLARVAADFLSVPHSSLKLNQLARTFRSAFTHQSRINPYITAQCIIADNQDLLKEAPAAATAISHGPVSSAADQRTN
eukprot:m.240806 g.240806  ORF g.240806 m.240806 type:complete len:723 (+) comp15315_c0_seq2:297-2465(+)